jgi:hypothetical protein
LGAAECRSKPLIGQALVKAIEAAGIREEE